MSESTFNKLLDAIEKLGANAHRNHLMWTKGQPPRREDFELAQELHGQVWDLAVMLGRKYKELEKPEL